MRNTKPIVVTLLLLAAVVVTTSPVRAIPSFARKLNLTCSSCHAPVPYLNATGRTFKETGYVLPDEDGEVDFEAQPGNQKISEKLVFDRIFPLAGRIKGYIVDDSEESETKIRPIHEFEIFSAGNFFRQGSWFIELEGEDEDDFETALAGSFAWHLNRQANFELGFGSVFRADPYNSLKDGGQRLTVSHKIPLDVGRGVGARFRSDAQYLSFYGRQDKVFYLVGYSAGNDNPEGEDPNDFLGRIAYDFTPDLMVGGFYFDGDREGFVTVSRWGIDWNLAFEDFYLVGLWMNSEEDFDAGTTNENDAYYLELFYTHRRDGRPLLVPLVRYGHTEANNGVEDIAGITAQLGWYVTENVKFAVEYFSQTDQVMGTSKRDRVTLLADLAF